MTTATMMLVFGLPLENDLADMHCRDKGSDLPIYRSDGRSLGVCFEDLDVFVDAGDLREANDLFKLISDAARLPWHIAQRWLGSQPRRTKAAISQVSGVIRPGENLLVLGQPGAGCTTTLKALANQRSDYPAITGRIIYGRFSPEDVEQRFNSEVVYVTEDDIHYPSLKVKHTLDFALRLRQPSSDTQDPRVFSEDMSQKLLDSLGISHTKDTLVGNSFVRGVSGGERKRVSLAEALATNPAVACWDNPIRGLDSSSALQFLQLLKKIASQTGTSNVVTLYQASESMYQQCFDRVLVLYKGRMIFSGEAKDARQYFVNLGFHAWERQTTPDFLTAVTSASERVVKDDHTGPVPRTPDEFAEAFRQSGYYNLLKLDIAAYHRMAAQNGSSAEAFEAEVQRVRSSFAFSSEPLAIWTQSLQATKRCYRELWQNRNDFYVVLFLNAVNAVLNGSAYFLAPKTATGSFEKGGALFFSLIYFFLNALAEVSSTISARSILTKQHQLGIIHPVGFVIAQTLADLPVALLQTLVFSCCYYFMLGLYRTASDFWIFELILFVHYSAVTSLFRMLGAWTTNLNFALLMAGTAMPICLSYVGYGPTVPTMHRWGSWIRRISPTPYALEALMGNEFSDIDLHCTPDQMVPYGPGYTEIQFQGCSLPRIDKGQSSYPGSVYLSLVYDYTRSHLWRNFGIILVMWFLYVVSTAVGLTWTASSGASSTGVVYKRGTADAKFPGGIGSKKPGDLEHRSPAHGLDDDESDSSADIKDETDSDTTRNVDTETVVDLSKCFTFKNVSYFVKVDSGERQLLKNVNGYFKPGQLTALMGASGAGKTTLLDTLSQRKDVGVVKGEMYMAGQPLDAAFSRSCGFCMQQDVHEPTATIREALQFSAKLRQSPDISDKQKKAYVEEVISLLELGPIADALVGQPGDGGLNVEQRKRVTIGVELAARPSALLFLDEVRASLSSESHVAYLLLTVFVVANVGFGQSSSIFHHVFFEKDCTARNASGLHHPPTFGDAISDVRPHSLASTGRPYRVFRRDWTPCRERDRIFRSPRCIHGNGSEPSRIHH
jgi:ATP-binding cassette subfamily G (WHITE) protein 2 (SNQ2)